MFKGHILQLMLMELLTKLGRFWLLGIERKPSPPKKEIIFKSAACWFISASAVGVNEGVDEK